MIPSMIPGMIPSMIPSMISSMISRMIPQFPCSGRSCGAGFQPAADFQSAFGSSNRDQSADDNRQTTNFSASGHPARGQQ